LRLHGTKAIKDSSGASDTCFAQQTIVLIRHNLFYHPSAFKAAEIPVSTPEKVAGKRDSKR
jgi:hypothetical protein